MKKKLCFFNVLLAALFVCTVAPSEGAASSRSKAKGFQTKTPIKHLVVIISENRSFDHLFGTYPLAVNPPNEPHFNAKKKTPSVNGFTEELLKHNANSFRPFRFDRSQATTIEPGHHFTQQQQQLHGGLLDRFVQVNKGNITSMGYYDGNTVTALWNYAQRFALSDNCFSTTMTSSSPGHINLVSGQTHGAIPQDLTLNNGEVAVVEGTLIGNANPAFDIYSFPPTVELTGTNVGDLLNEKGITWGYFQGGFRDCSQSHKGGHGFPVLDYIPHHQPFQYYRSTSNPDHLPPSSVKAIGYQDQANHQYDLIDFWAAVKKHNIPAVSFLQPAAYQDGHTRYSNLLLFQSFLVETVNTLQQLPEWKHMAVLVIWGDSGGWYDHVAPPVIDQSYIPSDTLPELSDAGEPLPKADRWHLGYGMRVPLLLLSPYAKMNYVNHSLLDQTSILRFIEDNWSLGRIGDQSFDAVAGSLKEMFNFRSPRRSAFILEPSTGRRKGIAANSTADKDNLFDIFTELSSENIFETRPKKIKKRR